jgi:S-adenosylmethionine uptake transporter
MLVASLLFSIMGVCVKLASAQYSTSEIVAYRGLIGMLILQSAASAGRHAAHHHGRIAFLARLVGGWHCGYGFLRLASYRWRWPLH